MQDDDDSQATVVPPGGGAPVEALADTGLRPSSDQAAGVPSFPIPGWDRYQCIRFLGQGGMGKVFLARDLRLHREVAIKFVRGDAADAIPRLIAEARAQARVSHDRVCKVYEVGEVGGEVYIAMQYIDGAPLGALGRTLTVEQAAMVVREAALGVNEAHHVGIIHRDLKPGNILVERAADGALRPYVMDFGLARDWTAAGATETGSVLGTPHYMAPEQARGEVARLDRRADVYALGATLYHVLAGAPPIPGSNGLEVLSRIETVEPRALRRLDPNIPADLEAIVMKCLEKDRSARYDSARALAEDLDRFLSGEPVAARRAGAWYRVRKRLLKHRRLAAAGAAALSLLGAALGWGIKTSLETAARVRITRQFTERVAHIEAMARYSALSPRHDIRGDQQAIRKEMTALGDEIRRAGAIASGSGNYALGRGYLALGEDAKAREHLEAAWQHGFREPRAAYALALVMGHLYQDKLREVERIEQEDRREARKREIDARYRDPALAYLAQSAGAEVPSAEYTAALASYYEGRLDEALGHLDRVGGALPWFYEAPELRGAILVSRAEENRLVRGDTAQALADLEAGRQALGKAAAIGGSAPSVQEATAQLEVSALRTELYGRGEVEPPFARGIEAAGRALEIAPDRIEAPVLDARLRRLMAEYRTRRGEPVDELLRAGVASAEKAVAAAPARPEARAELSRIFRQWAESRYAHGQDPRESLGRAAEVTAGIAADDRTYDVYENLGLVFKIWADYEDDSGIDSSPHRALAIDAYRHAIQIHDRSAYVFINLGINYYERAAQPRSADPDGDLGLAEAAFERAKAISPKPVVCYYRGKIHALRAARARARGADPGPSLGLALAAYREGIGINPKESYLHKAVGTLLLERAQDAWDRGADPGPLLDEADAAYRQAIAAAPADGGGLNRGGGALVERARFEHMRAADPSGSVRAAVAVLEAGLAREPGLASCHANLAGAYVILAEYELEAGRDPGASLRAANAAADRALASNPKDGEVWLYRARARATDAIFRARKQGGARVEELAAAVAAFEKAIALSPTELPYRLAFARFCGIRASWQRETGQDPAAALRRGIEEADRVSAARPAWPDARVQRGELLLLSAEAATDMDERRTRAAEAARELTAALSANANLEKRWRRRADAAAALGGAKP